MRALVSPLSLLFLAAAPACVSAEIDAPEICVGGMELPFRPEAYGTTTEDSISGDDLGVPDSDSLDLVVIVRSVAITPTEGVSDLDFLSSLSVRAASAEPDSGLDEVMLIQMDGGDHMDDGSMFAEPTQPADIADHLRAGEVVFRVDIDGALPDTMWMTDMDLCVHAVANYGS